MGTKCFNITFVNPLGPSNNRVRYFDLLKSLHDTKASKFRTYQELITAHARSRLNPMPISNLRGRHPATFTILTDVVRQVAVRASVPTQSVLMTRQALETVPFNATFLTVGLTPALWRIPAWLCLLYGPPIHRPPPVSRNSYSTSVISSVSQIFPVYGDFDNNNCELFVPWYCVLITLHLLQGRS